MNSTPASPIGSISGPHSLGPAYGSLLICTFLSLIFYGVALHQVYRYLRLHSSDGYLIKCYVGFLLTLDSFHTLLAIHLTYRNLVTNYFRPYRLADSLWSLNLQPLTTGLVIVTCQIFFARRAYYIGKSHKSVNSDHELTHIRSEYEVSTTGGRNRLSLAFTVQGFSVGNIDQLNSYAWLQSAGFGVAICADLILTWVLVMALHRSRTGFKQTNSVIDVLIAYSICTGFLTLIFALACFITAIASSGDLLLGALDLICVKVYVNSVLAALNARPTVKSHEPCELPGNTITLSAISNQSDHAVDKEWSSSAILMPAIGLPSACSIKTRDEVARGM